MSTRQNPSQDLPRWVSIQRTAEHLDISPRTVRRHIAAGLLRATRLGPRLLRVDRESIEAVGGVSR